MTVGGLAAIADIKGKQPERPHRRFRKIEAKKRVLNPKASYREPSKDGMPRQRPRIALFVDRLTQGGVQHSLLGLAQAFLDRDLVIGDRKGDHAHTIPTGARLFFLHGGSGTMAVNAVRAEWRAMRDREPGLIHGLPFRYRSFLSGLEAYLASKASDAMLSAKTPGNLTALPARQRSRQSTRLVISERGYVSEALRRSGKRWKQVRLPHLMPKLYPLADGIVAISNHVGTDLTKVAMLENGRAQTIYNALLRAEELIEPPADHPWFKETAPVILGAGRLGKQKDFPILLRAFTLMRARRSA